MRFEADGGRGAAKVCLAKLACTLNDPVKNPLLRSPLLRVPRHTFKEIGVEGRVILLPPRTVESGLCDAGSSPQDEHAAAVP
jgi:hypothetical protein